MKKTKETVTYHRLLSAVLALALLSGIIPNIPKATALDPNVYSGVARTYDFRLGGYLEDAEMGENARDYTSYGLERKWAYVGDTVSSTSPKPVLMTANFLQVDSLRGEWVAFKMDVPSAGCYKTSVYSYCRNAGAKVDIYSVPITESTALDDASIQSYCISANIKGGYDAYSLEPTYKTLPIGDVQFDTAGDHLIIFYVRTTNYSVRTYMYPALLTLNGIALGSASINLDKSEIEIDETATAIVTALMNDGITPATGYTIDGYTSSNEAVATVSSEGLVTAHAGGTAVITATVTLDGVTVTDTTTITVLGDAALSSIAVTTPPTKTEYRTGEALDITGLVVTGTNTDNSTQIETATLADISGFDSSTDNPNQTVTVTLGGKTTTFTVKIIRAINSAKLSKGEIITVDGNADEAAWSLNQSIPANTGDASATFGTLWDEENLYVYINVLDNLPIKTSRTDHIWYDDSVEIYIDGDLAKSVYTNHSAQYVFRYNDPIAWASAGILTNGVTQTSRVITGGYAMEIKIPWENIGGLTVEQGKTIGITVHVNDKDVDDPDEKPYNIIGYTVETIGEDVEDWENSANWAEMTLAAWRNPVAASNATGAINIDANGVANKANAITVTAGGNSYNNFGNHESFGIGSQVTLSAVKTPEVGKEFLYWMNPVSERFISNEQQFTFKIGTETQITAVYKDSSDGKHLVIFFDRNGKVLKSDYLNEGAPIVEPETLPYSVGYIFNNSWSSVVPTTAIKDEVFVAQYTEDTTPYTVSVENGTISPAVGNYAYNAEVTVTAGSFGEGRKFAYWSKDGVIVSYDAEYSFYVWDDTVICAVSIPEWNTVTAAPAIYMDEGTKTSVLAPENPNSLRLIVASERTLPDGYALIETGILISATVEEPTLAEGEHDLKAVAQSTQGNGQFTARVDGVTSGDSRFARAYMIYKIPGGDDYEIIYSNSVSRTV